MPIYEYKCDVCEAEREVILSLSESDTRQNCDCGQGMRKVPSLAYSIMPMTGKDKVLKVLNKEDGFGFPGKNDKHRKRYEKSFSKGLDPPKTTIGVGF